MKNIIIVSDDEEIDWPDEPKILLWRRRGQWKDKTLKGGIIVNEVNK